MCKILFLTANLSSGGAERQLVTLAKLLKSRDLVVEVLCYKEGDFYSSLLKEDDIPVHWEIFDNYFLRMIGIRRFIRKGKYNCVVSLLEVPNFLNNFSAIGSKKWKVITGESSSKLRTFCSKRGKIFGWFQRYADYIVCNSNNARNLWLKYHPKYSNKLRVIYNPILHPVITSTYIPKENNKTHIVIAASYQYLKNPIGVVKAVSLLDKKRRDKIKIEWFGSKNVTKKNIGAYTNAINLIKENDLEEVIYLNEQVTDIHEKMNKADFVGLFSELEGLPNAICEGMKIGKPIIMTRVSDYERLVGIDNGFICDWDNPLSIKNVFQAAINLDKSELLEMGRISKEKARTLFSNKNVLDSWIKLIV